MTAAKRLDLDVAAVAERVVSDIAATSDGKLGDEVVKVLRGQLAAELGWPAQPQTVVRADA